MKNKKVLVTIFILIMTLVIGTINVKAASYDIEANKKTVEVGEKVTITVKFVAAAWNVKVSGNGITGATYASQTSDLSEVETVKTFELDTSKSGTYTITVSGDITDANGTTQDLNKSCTVIVNERPVTPPATAPETPTTPEPETPTTPTPEPEEQPTTKELEFTSVNETVYATGTVNVRESYSTSSKSLGQLKEGDSVTRTGVSKTTSENYYWSKITYNGITAYVISSKVTTVKPEQKEEPEQPAEEEPAEQTTVEENPQTVDTDKSEADEVKDGLQSLQIEGVTLSPVFSSDVYEYRTIVKEDISELVINAVPVVEGAAVTVAGNTNLTEGENLITIVVYNVDGNVEATYQITVNKNTLDLSETDNWLRLGTTSARRNLMIFGIVFVVAIVALIVVMILKRKNQSYEENEEDIDEQLSTDDEQNVENEEEIETEEEMNEEETHRTRRDKRKGKHF